MFFVYLNKRRDRAGVIARCCTDTLGKVGPRPVVEWIDQPRAILHTLSGGVSWKSTEIVVQIIIS